MTHGFSKSSNCDRFRYSVCVSLLPTCVLSRFRALRIALIDHARVRTAHDDKAWMSKDPAPGFCHTWGNDRPTVAHFPPVRGWTHPACIERDEGEAHKGRLFIMVDIMDTYALLMTSHPLPPSVALGGSRQGWGFLLSSVLTPPPDGRPGFGQK